MRNSRFSAQKKYLNESRHRNQMSQIPTSKKREHFVLSLFPANKKAKQLTKRNSLRKSEEIWELSVQSCSTSRQDNFISSLNTWLHFPIVLLFSNEICIDIVLIKPLKFGLFLIAYTTFVLVQHYKISSLFSYMKTLV